MYIYIFFPYFSYDALAQHYGAPEEYELRKLDMSIKGNMVELAIECPANRSFKTMKKRIPQSLTVQKLRPLIARIVKKPRDEFVLSVRSIDDPEIEHTLDNDLRQLKFYSLRDGDAIVVQ